MNDSEQLISDASSLTVRLTALRTEHRDLDAVITEISEATVADELLLRRLKKRKLVLKDRISIFERMLDPDILA